MHNTLKSLGFITGLLVGLLGCIWIAPSLGMSVMDPPEKPEAPPSQKENAKVQRASPKAEVAVPPRPQQKVLAASFEEVEKISATKQELDAKEKEALQKFSYPPLSFSWSGRPQDLAPAFIWETPDGVFHLGDRPIAGGPGGDALLENYSGTLKILMPNNGQLRMHFNVVSRIRAWAQEAQADIKNQNLKVIIASPRPNEVTLRMPAVGSKPARTLVVTI